MGKLDVETKKMMRNPSRFADAFNFLIYDGEDIIKPEDLRELDTTEIEVLQGAEGKEVAQKIRDVIKGWSTVMYDAENIYVVLGIENESDVNYIMPVQNMNYDAMQYMKQVNAIVAKHKENKEWGTENGEFIRKFQKEDRLMPVITLVIHFGSDKWDGPKSIKEMLGVKDKSVLRFVQDYKINLISPYSLSPAKLKKFRTDLGPVLEYIKYSKNKDKLYQVTHANDCYQNLDKDAFNVLNDATNSKLKPVQRGDKVDVCAAIEDMKKEAVMEDRERTAKAMLQAGADVGLVTVATEMTKNAVLKIAKSIGCVPVR